MRHLYDLKRACLVGCDGGGDVRVGAVGLGLWIVQEAAVRLPVHHQGVGQQAWRWEGERFAERRDHQGLAYAY